MGKSCLKLRLPKHHRNRRIKMPPNNTIGLAGRFCNHLIRNLYASFLAEAGDLCMRYSYPDEIRRLGLQLYSGSKMHKTTIIIRDNDFLTFLDKPIHDNIFVDWLSAQNHEFALRLYQYFRSDKKDTIMNANIYKERYNANNNVFVHLRLGDVAQLNPGYTYYENALKIINVSSGYISSDSPDHPWVQALAEKYGLQIMKKDEVDTIMLASTCKHIVLSHGTFSWTIGAFGFFSNVYIPPHSYNTWTGDIFRMPSWQVVEP